MERKSIKPRDNYQRIVENLGFTFHKDYWLEDACYALSMSEVEQIEKATAECYDMYCQAVEKCLYDDRRLDLLRIPQKVRNFIRRSWEEDDLSLYGRFDFALVDGQLKMLEFNADTPTSLLEAAVVQWQWKEDVFPANDQFNGIHEGLVASWKDIHKAYRCDQYFFASVSDFEEDNMTLKYLIATAIEAGLVTGEIDIEDIMHVNGTLYASPENPISCMFKLFPWETMFEQNPDACMTEMCWLEPLWKSLMSDKAMLPILHELFPHSPYILPAFFEPGNSLPIAGNPFFPAKAPTSDWSATACCLRNRAENTAKRAMSISSWWKFPPITAGIRLSAAGLSAANRPVSASGKRLHALRII